MTTKRKVFFFIVVDSKFIIAEVFINPWKEWNQFESQEAPEADFHSLQ